ncbi:FAD-binding domain-containing protein [Nemania sp. NC0429]|nr:FAD-binding domain-containing protein [Nemania sp. NC0429]
MAFSKLGRSHAWLAALLLSGVPRLASGAPSVECCSLISGLLETDVFTTSTATYDHENNDFWSATEILEPSCVFLPDTPEKVAQAVALFVERDCSFSIKGGGHSAIPGAASIHDGILMPMEKLKRLEISDDEETVVVGAGNLMGDIYAGLDPSNLTAMIGRYEKVGLGVAVGAGFSYLVNKNGLAVDNVVNFEVVLANASIVNANATHNSDLFKALKGGSNNFGIVTAFTLRTERTEGSVYGGIVYYNETYLDQVSDVIYDYHVRQAVDDTLTHALPQYGYNGTTGEAISFNPVVYNRAVNELPEIMQGWTDIPTYKNTLQNRDYHSLAVELNDGFPDGLVQEQRVFSVYADAQLYKDFWAHYHAWCQGYQHIPGFYCLHVNMPITPRAVQEGIAKGHNSLGLENAGDRVLGTIYFGVTCDSLDDADEVLPAHDKFVESMIDLAKERGLHYPYIMLTYSGYDQKVIESYGEENVKKMLEVQKAYDPNGVFQRLVPGGQKLPSDAN